MFDGGCGLIAGTTLKSVIIACDPREKYNNEAECPRGAALKLYFTSAAAAGRPLRRSIAAAILIREH